MARRGNEVMKIKRKTMMTKKEIAKYQRMIEPFYIEMAHNEYLQEMQKDDAENLSFFCTQWGGNWDGGILFVGRATNGWSHIDLQDLPFNQSNQMKWVHDVWNAPEEDSTWTGAGSPFWRVIRRITSHFYPYKKECDKWYSHIAWSNIYKCSFTAGGNPTMRLMRETIKPCQRLLEVDLEMLKPKVVVMFTESNLSSLDEPDRSWAGPFLKGFKKYKSIEGECPLRIYRKGFMHVIVSERPECRPEDIRVQSIVAAIEKYSSLQSCNTIVNNILHKDVLAKLNSLGVMWKAQGACSCECRNEDGRVTFIYTKGKKLPSGVEICCVFDHEGFEGCQVAAWNGKSQDVHIGAYNDVSMRKEWHIHEDEGWLAWKGVRIKDKNLSRRERERGMNWDVKFFERIQNDSEYKQLIAVEIADSIRTLYKMLTA